MLNQTTLPHDWREILAEAERFDMSIYAVVRRKATAQDVAELDKEIAEQVDGAKALIDLAKSEDRELTDDEQATLDGWMNEDTGTVYALKAERRELEKLIALKKSAARAFDDTRGTRDPFAGPDDLPAPSGTTSLHAERPQLAIRDEHGHPIRAMASDEPLFPSRRNSAFDDEAGPVGFGEGIRSHLRGESLSPQASVVTTFDSGGGFLIGEESSGILLDRVRSEMVMGRSGMRSIPMGEPTIRIATIIKDPEARWVAELERTPSSSISWGQLTMEARKLRIVLTLSQEFIADSANGAQIVEQTAVRVAALGLDRAALSGAGTGAEPLGLINTAGVNVVDTIGVPTDYRHISSGVGKIISNDFAGSASDLTLISHPQDAGVLDQLTDTTGQPLRPTTWVEDLQKLSTSSLRNDLGAGSNESEAAVVHGPSCLMGVRNQIRGKLYDAGTVADGSGKTFDAPSQDVSFLVLFARVDFVCLRPSWQTVLSGIRTS